MFFPSVKENRYREGDCKIDSFIPTIKTPSLNKKWGCEFIEKQNIRKFLLMSRGFGKLGLDRKAPDTKDFTNVFDIIETMGTKPSFLILLRAISFEL